MKTYIARAREIAKGIEAGLVWVDADLADEITGLLESMATTIETQSSNVTCIEFALRYYGEPDLYQAGVALDDVILDGGLRARTALALLKKASTTRTVLQTQGD